LLKPARHARSLGYPKAGRNRVRRKSKNTTTPTRFPRASFQKKVRKALQKAKEKMGGEVQGAEALLPPQDSAAQGRS
jgi:hypothetical protein